MRYQQLGDTGLTVSIVSFGTSPLGNMFGAVGDRDAEQIVHRALDAGINFFDTSPCYGGGLAETRLGKAMRGRRDEVVVGTKAGRYGVDRFDFSPSRIRASLEQSLRRLGTDYVDIFQLHDIEYVNLEPVLTDSYAELVRLRDDGKCRFIGMTGYPTATLCQRSSRPTSTSCFPTRTTPCSTRAFRPPFCRSHPRTTSPSSTQQQSLWVCSPTEAPGSSIPPALKSARHPDGS